MGVSLTRTLKLITIRSSRNQDNLVLIKIIKSLVEITIIVARKATILVITGSRKIETITTPMPTIQTTPT